MASRYLLQTPYDEQLTSITGGLPVIEVVRRGAEWRWPVPPAALGLTQSQLGSCWQDCTVTFTGTGRVEHENKT